MGPLGFVKFTAVRRNRYTNESRMGWRLLIVKLQEENLEHTLAMIERVFLFAFFLARTSLVKKDLRGTPVSICGFRAPSTAPL